MYLEFLQSAGAAAIRGEAKKLRNKDADFKGGDDAGATAMEVLATIVETADFGHIQDIKTIRNMGKMFEAVGKQLQAEADKADAGK